MARKSTVTIVSVYPGELVAGRPYGPERGQGWHNFRLAPAPMDGYTKLAVEDCYQYTYLGENVGSRYDLIPANTIANDLVNNWTKNVVGNDEGMGPGVFVAAGDNPTPDELANARISQELYFEHLINQAEQKYRESRFEEITDTHRLAAVWMGREAVEWLRPIRKEARKKCPLCITEIPAEAVVCPNCRNQIGEIPADIARLSRAASVQSVTQSRKGA